MQELAIPEGSGKHPSPFLVARKLCGNVLEGPKVSPCMTVAELLGDPCHRILGFVQGWKREALGCKQKR